MAPTKNQPLYVRNRKPNTVILTFGRGNDKIREKLGRRGTRSDTVAFEAEVRQDQNFRRYVTAGLIEEITEAEFLTLGEREGEEFDPDQTPQELGNPLAGKIKRAPVVQWDIDDTATIEKFPREWLTPTLEFATEEETDDAIIKKLIEVTGASEEQARQMLALRKAQVPGAQE